LKVFTNNLKNVCLSAIGCSFGGIERFWGLFCINLCKLIRKVARRTNTLKFSKAVLLTLQASVLSLPWVASPCCVMSVDADRGCALLPLKHARALAAGFLRIDHDWITNNEFVRFHPTNSMKYLSTRFHWKSAFVGKRSNPTWIAGCVSYLLKSSCIWVFNIAFIFVFSCKKRHARNNRARGLNPSTQHSSNTHIIWKLRVYIFVAWYYTTYNYIKKA